jgi:phenylalanyl-tRNA synthetase beta chain
MRVKTAAHGWRVTPPSYRFDIKQECDLIEEVARIYGYEKLPSQMPRFEMAEGAQPESRIPEGRMRDVLIDRDYQEVITYSFVDPDLQKLIDPAVPPAALANPIASNMSVMRTSLWPGLLQAVLYNQNRQQARIRLFEIGRCFVRRNGKINQDKALAGVITGPAFAEQWGTKSGPADFYDIKGDVEALLELTGEKGNFRFKPTTHPALQPGQAAEIIRKGASAGFLGALHPQIQHKLDLDGPVFLFELELFQIEQAIVPSFQEISKFPSIRRDISVIIDRQIPAQDVLDCVSQAAGQLLVNLQLFDEYRGEGIDSGRKSLALTLTLQDTSRTLREEVVEAVMTQVIAALHSRFGAQLRQ